MNQPKVKYSLSNWDLVTVNPNYKTWNWKDLFCFWGANVQSLIGFSLISSLYLMYSLNVFVVFFGIILGSFFVYLFSNAIGKPSQKFGLPFAVLLRSSLGFNLTWFAILVAVNLQTAWLSPPVALSAYFLKGVVPEWELKAIYYGMMQFMVLQIIGLVLIIIFPKIALWLPTLLYGQ